MCRVVAVFAGSFVWTDITMFTPRPRESEAASSPSGRDVEYERLPPSAIPDRLDPSKRVELEAEKNIYLCEGLRRVGGLAVWCSLTPPLSFLFRRIKQAERGFVRGCGRS